MRRLAAAVLALACLPAGAAEPEQGFFANLRALCGQAFEGRIVANEPKPATTDAFEGQRLVMHVRDCTREEIRIPFAVGEDRSRTWIVTDTPAGLRLKHDHRHADGTPDAVTMYGGDTMAPGTAARQEFPADAESKALFEREGLAASVDNTWALEIDPGRAFVYELARPKRMFRIEFDLANPISSD